MYIKVTVAAVVSDKLEEGRFLYGVRLVNRERLNSKRPQTGEKIDSFDPEEVYSSFRK